MFAQRLRDMNFLTVYVRKAFFTVHLGRDGGKDTVQSTGTLWDEAGVTGLGCMPSICLWTSGGHNSQTCSV